MATGNLALPAVSEQGLVVIHLITRKWSNDFSQSALPDYGRNTPKYLFFVGILSRHAAFAKMTVDEIHDDFVNFVFKYYEHPFVIHSEVKKRKDATDWEVEDEVLAVIDEIDNTAQAWLKEEEMEIVGRLYLASEKLVLFRHYMKKCLKRPVPFEPKGERAWVTKNSVTSELTITNNASTEEELEEILEVISPFKNVNSLDLVDKDNVEFYITMTLNKLKRMKHNFFPKVIPIEDDLPVKAINIQDKEIFNSTGQGDFATRDSLDQKPSLSIRENQEEMDEKGDHVQGTSKMSEFKGVSQPIDQGVEIETGKTCSLF